MYYQQAREQVNQHLREAIADRADTNNDLIGRARKLAHLWHGPVAEKIGEYAVRLEVAGSTYSTFPVVNVSKIKLVKMFPDRPIARLNGEEGGRVELDEALHGKTAGPRIRIQMNTKWSEFPI
ncbi:hypothetical protein PHMEG_00025308 [Phytophthora megakarya]|uniref:Reverse transcriptase n=1 Tax=Phytophthora megakarya TaxID=4795 RepID=A0A225VCH0_9STRA|nr:hypothetical protein PHMEG_00025308 [Phytophthora megakarya]